MYDVRWGSFFSIWISNYSHTTYWKDQPTPIPHPWTTVDICYKSGKPNVGGCFWICWSICVSVRNPTFISLMSWHSTQDHVWIIIKKKALMLKRHWKLLSLYISKCWELYQGLRITITILVTSNIYLFTMFWRLYQHF